MKLFFALVALVGLSLAVFIYTDISTQPASVITTTFSGESEEKPVVVIIRTAHGYEPDELVVEKGTKVLWKNESLNFHWPASNFHPVHSEYSEFDSMRPLGPGEEWSFTFDEVGEWGFHDHIRASVTGIILVENPDEESFELEEGQFVE